MNEKKKKTLIPAKSKLQVVGLGSSKSVKNVRSSYVQVRLTSSERRQIDKSAKALDISISDFIRKLVKEKYTEIEGQYSIFKK